ncbi:MAG: tRNA (N(6)-L-threonylcarbamoyladenosine(37)-C(2))-methylthiotransferase MtaB [Candidatus Korobacteraceae bacterium]
MGTFFVENFGCRATQADGAAMERDLLEKGMTRAPATAQAELVVLNTCTVTTSADHDARATIRRIHRENPGARIIVTGCYAQRAPGELASLPGVSLVVGNSHKSQLANIAMERAGQLVQTETRPLAGGFVPLSALKANLPQNGADEKAPAEIIVGDIFAHTELTAAPVFEADTASEKTRPNLKVQDGCNNRCSFCIIPFVRGKSRSLKMEQVLASVRQLVASGYREIVLSGINLGRWGRDFSSQVSRDNAAERVRFVDLLQAILAETMVEKIRISSVEPMDWSDELIDLAACSPRICKHAHVPLQSGSDRILRQMHRRYRPWHYADRILRIRRAMPDAAIGADVMVGFPGETDDDFEQTRALIESLPFTYLHVFTYSSRPGTPSAAMPAQVRGDVTHERNRILRELAARKKRHFQEGFVGRTLEAITLTHVDKQQEFTEALTGNYQKLWVEGVHAANQAILARIVGIEGDALLGQLVG